MKARKILSLALAAVMLTACLTGCGGGGDKSGGSKGSGTPSGTTSTPSGTTGGNSSAASSADKMAKFEVTEPVTIEFWYNGSGNEEFYMGVADEFNKSQDKITVVPVCGGNYAAINEQIIGAQAARTGLPGISVVNYSTLPNYVQSGVAEPLNEYLEAYGVDTGDFIQGFMDVANYDGTQYAMPHSISCFVYYYNRDLLKQAGLSTDFPTTWDEFRTWALDVHKATGKPALLMAANEKTVNYNMMQNFGGTFIKEDNTTGLDAESLKTHMKEMKELIDAGAVEWSLDSSDILSSKFINGDVVAYNLSCTTYSKFLEMKDVGIAWNFKSEDNISTVTGSYLFIPADISQNEKNAGFAFMNYLTSPEVNFRWVKFSSYLTSHKSIFNDEAQMADIYNTLPEMRNVYAGSELMVPKPKTTLYDSGIKAYYTALSKIYLEGADFDTTWDAMVDEVNYILAGN